MGVPNQIFGTHYSYTVYPPMYVVVGGVLKIIFGILKGWQKKKFGTLFFGKKKNNNQLLYWTYFEK